MNIATFDYNNIPFGENGAYVNTVIEIPMGSMLKIEWNRKKGYMVLDRVEPKIFAKPVNYGFIPGTLDEDGDELDTLVITEEPIPTGVVLEKAKVIGVLEFIDSGEKDFKIILAPGDDRNSDSVNSFSDLDESWKKQIEHHFAHYKDLKKPGSTMVQGFGDETRAWEIITECIERAKKET